MLTTFCANCGKGTKYETTKPKFCSHCGKDLTAFFASKTKTETKTRKRIIVKNDDEDDDDDDGSDIEINEVTPFEFEVKADASKNVYKLGNIVDGKPRKLKKGKFPATNWKKHIGTFSIAQKTQENQSK